MEEIYKNVSKQAYSVRGLDDKEFFEDLDTAIIPPYWIVGAVVITAGLLMIIASCNRLVEKVRERDFAISQNNASIRNRTCFKRFRGPLLGTLNQFKYMHILNYQEIP